MSRFAFNRTPWFPPSVKPVRSGWYECSGTRGLVWYYYDAFHTNMWCKQLKTGELVALKRSYSWRGRRDPNV